MNKLDELYNDLIMEHSVASPNKKHLEHSNCSMLGHNPNCGDEITLEALVENGKVVDIAFSGQGCAISQSSTSIMIDTLRGKSVDEAKIIIEIFMKMIRREEISADEKKLLKNARAFENISSMPARVKCALLSWHTFENLLSSLENK